MKLHIRNLRTESAKVFKIVEQQMPVEIENIEDKNFCNMEGCEYYGSK